MANQNPEQLARDNIDAQLVACGWEIQDKTKINLSAGLGVAVREYQTDVGPVDYALFLGGKAIGVAEAKREEEGQKLSAHETQVEDYATAKLKRINNEPLPFIYLSTGVVRRFTDTRDHKPRFQEVFTFHRPETLQSWYKKAKSLRRRMTEDIPPLNTHTAY